MSNIYCVINFLFLHTFCIEIIFSFYWLNHVKLLKLLFIMKHFDKNFDLFIGICTFIIPCWKFMYNHKEDNVFVDNLDYNWVTSFYKRFFY